MTRASRIEDVGVDGVPMSVGGCPAPAGVAKLL